MSSNCLVYLTSGGIPVAFLFLIFLRTESSSCVNGPSLKSNCILIILVIGSCVTFGGFPSRFSKCCFHSFILSCWFAAVNFALVVLFLLLTSFIVCQAILDCLSSSESLILSIWFCTIQRRSVLNYSGIDIYEKFHIVLQECSMYGNLSIYLSILTQTEYICNVSKRKVKDFIWILI